MLGERTESHEEQTNQIRTKRVHFSETVVVIPSSVVFANTEKLNNNCIMEPECILKDIEPVKKKINLKSNITTVLIFIVTYLVYAIFDTLMMIIFPITKPIGNHNMSKRSGIIELIKKITAIFI